MERGERFKRLKNALADHYKAQGLPDPSAEELDASVDALTRFFELLVEADRKVSSPNATPNLRSPDCADPA